MDNGEDTEDEAASTTDDDVVIRRVLARQTSYLKERMDPNLVCDQMEERDMLNHMVIRDIREKLTTTEKNDSILATIQSNPDLYPAFKKCLGTNQEALLKSLVDIEKEETALRRRKTGPQPEKRLSAKVRSIKQDIIDLYSEYCQHVPVFPGSPKDKTPVSAVYVTPKFQVLESKRVSCYNRPRSCEGCQIESYRQIFYADGQLLCKNIYISADAGYGKTAFCENLVYTWCQVQKRGQDQQTEIKTIYNRKSSPHSDNESVMAQFDLLFYISLRYSSGLKSIEEMITDQLQVDLDDDILDCTNCLIVLDGLDEWSCPSSQRRTRFESEGLPSKGKKLKKMSTILTTSRPWKLEKLGLGTLEIDNHVKICGLSEAAANTLVKKVVKELNDKYDKDHSAEDFIKEVTDSHLYIASLTPVILMHIICLWHDGINIGDSRCAVFSDVVDLLIRKIDDQEMQEDVLVHNRLPDCFKDCTMCQKYADLLIAVCKLAFKTLLGENRESELVFKHSDSIIHGMNTLETEMCLKFGILSQCKVIGKRCAKEKMISFPHKTLQEFFAALHIVISGENFIVKLYGVDRMLELAQILLFVVQMKPEIAQDLSERLVYLCNQDERIKTYRLGNDYSVIDSNNYMLICNIQEFVNECQRNIPDGHNKMQLVDVVFDKNSITRNADCMLKTNKTHMKSLYIDIPNIGTISDDQLMQVRDAIENTSASKSLERLYIWDTKSRLDKAHVKTLLSCPTLLTVGLREMDLRACVEFSNFCKTMNSFRLQDVRLNHDQICGLLSLLSSISTLKSLTVGSVMCIEHKSSPGDCSLQLDCQGNTNLRYLYLEDFSANSILFSPKSVEVLKLRYQLVPGSMETALGCLGRCEKVKILDIRGYPQDTDIKLLTQIIANMQKLETLVLWQMNIDRGSLLLSSGMKNLKCIKLRSVQFKQASFEAFLESIPENDNIITVELEEISVLNDRQSEIFKCISETKRFDANRAIRTFERNNRFSVVFNVSNLKSSSLGAEDELKSLESVHDKK